MFLLREYNNEKILGGTKANGGFPGVLFVCFVISGCLFVGGKKNTIQHLYQASL